MALRHGRPEKMSTGRRAVEGRQKNKFFSLKCRKIWGGKMVGTYRTVDNHSYRNNLLFLQRSVRIANWNETGLCVSLAEWPSAHQISETGNLRSLYHTSQLKPSELACFLTVQLAAPEHISQPVFISNIGRIYLI